MRRPNAPAPSQRPVPGGLWSAWRRGCPLPRREGPTEKARAWRKPCLWHAALQRIIRTSSMMSLSISTGGGWRPAPATRASRCARSLRSGLFSEGGEGSLRDPLCERKHRRVERELLPILRRAAGHEASNPREAGKLRPTGLAWSSSPSIVGNTGSPEEQGRGAPAQRGRGSGPPARFHSRGTESPRVSREPLVGSLWTRARELPQLNLWEGFVSRRLVQ